MRTGKTGSGRAGSGKTGIGKAGSGRAGSEKTGIGKAGSKKTGSGKAGTRKAGSRKTGIGFGTAGKNASGRRKTRKQYMREARRKQLIRRLKRWLARMLAVLITGFVCLVLIHPQVQNQIRSIPGFSKIQAAAGSLLSDASSQVKGMLQGIAVRSGSAVLPGYLQPESTESVDLASIPAYSGSPYVVVNGNVPDFSESELTATAFETYGSMDGLGRCSAASACVGIEIMPTEERGAIGQVRPSGWHTVKYEFIDGRYLYNRCHLIGYQLTGENANVQNLITGTRYLNVEGMLPFEDQVASYVRTTGNHVMYRVTPVYDGNNLVASGVEMEAYSVEDRGTGVCFHVFVYNVQPGVIINYANGESRSAAQ